MKMSRSFTLTAFLLVGLLVVACGKTDTNRNATATVTGEPIGVPECDTFLNAYESCISTRIPEGQRAQFQTLMTNWRADWKKLAADPQTRAGLPLACQKHLETARTQMKSYNCTF
jgi:hypothetical protein